MSEASRARELILAHGWNTTCYQILNPGIKLWFSCCGDAVVGYVRRAGMRVVAGAPVCAVERLPDVVVEWEGAERRRVCYFGAEERLRSALGSQPGYATVSLGAQPVWTPGSWLSRVGQDPSLRAQLARATHKDVVVREWDARQAHGHPELRRCLREWLLTRGLPSMHFLVEPQTLDHLGDRRVFVAECQGGVLGFVVLAPIPQKNGWLTEQFVRGAEAPNGTIELTLHAAVRAIQADGFGMVTMGIVPLSQYAEVAATGSPPWLPPLSRWIRAHGRRFYNFEGLDQFKSKFRPDFWEPIHVISKERQFSFRTLYAIAAAFSDGNPAVSVVRGLGLAVRRELSR